MPRKPVTDILLISRTAFAGSGSGTQGELPEEPHHKKKA